jgi:homoserine trans-succinylase
MTDLEILDCCQVILDYLLDDSDYKNYNSIYEIPSFSKMILTLENFRNLDGRPFDMVSFTKFLNNKYQIHPEGLWEKSAKEFFSTNKSKSFYKNIIRDFKLDMII